MRLLEHFFRDTGGRGKYPDILAMYQLPGLDKAAFDKADRSPDAEFYREPRFVVHIDDGAIGTVTATYAEVLPRGGAILDLMSSWVSHLPADAEYAPVVGLGMNAQELAANDRLSRWFVQDLNDSPILPLESGTFDAACLCVSVQYLQRPVDVFCEVARVLRLVLRSSSRSQTAVFRPRPWTSGRRWQAPTSRSS